MKQLDCIFCKIVNEEIPSKKIYEDENILAFYDANPQSPKHFLVIPKEHIESMNDINSENSHLISQVFNVISKLAKELKIDKDGYRIVNNCGKMGGQTVDHLHFHVLSGRQLMWPPG